MSESSLSDLLDGPGPCRSIKNLEVDESVYTGSINTGIFSTIFVLLSSTERERHIIYYYTPQFCPNLAVLTILINPAAAAWRIKFHHHPDSFAQLIL